MATVRNLLGIFCFAFFGQLTQFSGNFLSSEVKKVDGGKEVRWEDGKVGDHQLPSSTTTQLHRSTILRIAQSQIGIRETTGKNDGVVVEAYLRYTGNKKGEPWCASFVSWIYGKAGHVKPKTAWSPALFPLARQTLNPLPADVFGIYFSKLKRIAHCGLIEKQHGKWFTTIEGNTNWDGSREGDGVYRKLRHQRSIKYYANWIKKSKEVLK